VETENRVVLPLPHVSEVVEQRGRTRRKLITRPGPQTFTGVELDGRLYDRISAKSIVSRNRVRRLPSSNIKSGKPRQSLFKKVVVCSRTRRYNCSYFNDGMSGLVPPHIDFSVGPKAAGWVDMKAPKDKNGISGRKKRVRRLFDLQEGSDLERKATGRFRREKASRKAKKNN